MDLQHGARREASGGSEAQADPLTVLVAIARQRRALDAAQREIIQRARQQGVTFDQIGKALGVTRQAVHARLRRAKNGSLALVPLASYDDLLDAVTSLLT
ncbi:MAG TPA: sigma factor-like helix-turn-helix DNA-binding protein [Solirubrobacterales bacterium]